MRYKKVKAAGVSCRRLKMCVRYNKNGFRIKAGEYAIDRGPGGWGFICKDCAPHYINEEYAALIALSKDIISKGDGEMTDAIIWSLGGDLEKIIEDKK
jgi:hypothetical protein